MWLWLFFIYIYKENLTKFTIENMFTFQNSYFCWKKNLIKTHFFNKLVCLQLLAKYLCNLSSFDKVGLHHNKNNLVIHNFLHFFFFFFFLYFLELHVLSIALESLIFDHMLWSNCIHNLQALKFFNIGLCSQFITKI